MSHSLFSCLSLLHALQLGDVMVDIASNIMLADERVLWLAQREAKACSRIVQCLQRVATYRLASGAHVYSTVSATLFYNSHESPVL